MPKDLYVTNPPDTERLRDAAKRATSGPSPEEINAELDRDTRGEAFDSLINRIAFEERVPRELLRRMVKQESAFNPAAVSPKGAVGLMQLLPATFAEQGVKGDIRDPEANLRAGARYVRKMIDQHRGSLELALAAYNAGPGAVQKYGGVPPFPETQGYVRNIIEGGQPGQVQIDQPPVDAMAVNAGPMPSSEPAPGTVPAQRLDQQGQPVAGAPPGAPALPSQADQDIAAVRNTLAAGPPGSPTIPASSTGERIVAGLLAALDPDFYQQTVLGERNRKRTEAREGYQAALQGRGQQISGGLGVAQLESSREASRNALEQRNREIAGALLSLQTQARQVQPRVKSAVSALEKAGRKDQAAALDAQAAEFDAALRSVQPNQVGASTIQGWRQQLSTLDRAVAAGFTAAGAGTKVPPKERDTIRWAAITLASLQDAEGLIKTFGDLGGPIVGRTPGQGMFLPYHAERNELEGRFSDINTMLLPKRLGAALPASDRDLLQGITFYMTDPGSEKARKLKVVRSVLERNLAGLRAQYGDEEIDSVMAAVGATQSAPGAPGGVAAPSPAAQQFIDTGDYDYTGLESYEETP